YTLSLGHMEDLTLDSFAYLRLPLFVAGIAFVIGAIGCAVAKGRRAFVAAGIMMVLFFQAARLALVVFDPYLSSRPLAQALLEAPPGRLIVDHHYYTFSSIFFYTDRTALLRNGRIQNLVYGSYAPGAPDIFINDSQFAKIWLEPGRSYIIADDSAVPGLEKLVGASSLIVIAHSGGKVLLSNETVPAAHT
ncbi:MAG TPA: glycosyltransferase family 39 protein, partial [Bryobacteraceae bacterium]